MRLPVAAIYTETQERKIKLGLNHHHHHHRHHDLITVPLYHRMYVKDKWQVSTVTLFRTLWWVPIDVRIHYFTAVANGYHNERTSASLSCKYVHANQQSALPQHTRMY